MGCGTPGDSYATPMHIMVYRKFISMDFDFDAGCDG
jgi:hypothetical protein